MVAWMVIHGFLGTVFAMGLAVAIWQAQFPAHRSLRPLKVNAIALTVLVTLKDFLGDLVYVTYRADVPDSARSVILAGSRPWVHEIIMEYKEHMAHFLPAILLVAVALLFVYDIREPENRTARKVVVSLFAVSLALALAALFMGALLTSTAPVK
jgi:hypothetical protein